jgi:hypothetical protein
MILILFCYPIINVRQRCGTRLFFATIPFLQLSLCQPGKRAKSPTDAQRELSCRHRLPLRGIHAPQTLKCANLVLSGAHTNAQEELIFWSGREVTQSVK